MRSSTCCRLAPRRATATQRSRLGQTTLCEKRGQEGDYANQLLLRSLGYNCDWAAVRAKDLYVPQNRDKACMDFLYRPSLATYDAALGEQPSN